MDYSVRRANVDDAPGIAVVSVASWKAAYRGLLPDQLLDNLSVTQRQERVVNAALARLDELGFISATLWVLDGNERAFNFYRQTGWQQNGVCRLDTRPGGIELPETQFHRAVVRP